MVRRRRRRAPAKVEITKDAYAALAHPVRRRILALLAERGALAFTEIQRELKAPTGVLFHHLDTMLSTLLSQDDKKQYSLTEQGQLVCRLMATVEEELQRAAGAQRRLQAILPTELFSRLLASPLKALPEAVALAALMAWLLAQAGYSLVGLLLIPAQLLPEHWVVSSIPLSWLFVFAICELLALLLIGRRKGQAGLIAGIPISLLPIMILPAMISLERWGILFGISQARPLLALIYAATCCWSLVLLTACLCISKGVRLERAALVTLGLLYVNTMVLAAIVIF